MITLRRNADRRHVQHGDHHTWYTFHPQDHPGTADNGVGVLIDFNEVWLPPGEGTVPYPGTDAEILTYVHEGALAQEDSAGRASVIQAGEFQRSTTRPGVHRVATNASRTNWSHLFQILLRSPMLRAEHPTEQKRYTAAQRRNGVCLVASPDGRGGSLRVHQNVFVYSSILDPGHHFFHALPPGRSAWFHLLFGAAALRDLALAQGDSVGVSQEPSVSLTVRDETELLLVDLCPTPRAHFESSHSYGGRLEERPEDQAGAAGRQARGPARRDWPIDR